MISRPPELKIGFRSEEKYVSRHPGQYLCTLLSQLNSAAAVSLSKFDTRATCRGELYRLYVVSIAPTLVLVFEIRYPDCQLRKMMKHVYA